MLADAGRPVQGKREPTATAICKSKDLCMPWAHGGSFFRKYKLGLGINVRVSRVLDRTVGVNLVSEIGATD